MLISGLVICRVLIIDARDGTPGSMHVKTISGPAVKELTIPQPFKFNLPEKKVVEMCHSPFVPLALKVKAFETNTPDRFKKKV